MARKLSKAFSRVSHTPYYLPLKDEWLTRSLDTPEQKLLEKLLCDKDNSTFLILKKKEGIQREEYTNLTVDPFYKTHQERHKEYLIFMESICLKTGLTTDEVFYRNSRDNLDLKDDLDIQLLGLKEQDIAGLNTKEKDILTRSITNLEEKLRGLKETMNEEKEKITKKMGDLSVSLNDHFLADKTSQMEYYYALIGYFLSGSRVLVEDINEQTEEVSLLPIKLSFTADNVKNLHEGFIQALIDFTQKELNGSWGETEEKK